MKPIVAKGLAVLVWAATLVGGILAIYVSQFIAMSIYVRFFLEGASYIRPMDAETANALRITTVLIATLIYVVFLIATSEYHLKRLGSRESWRLLGISVAVEVLIILAGVISGPVTW